MARSARKGRPALLYELPTAVGGITRAAIARAMQVGLDTESLLKCAGLTSRQVTDPHNRIAVKDQIKFLNLVADALNDDFLGIRLAQRVDLRELGLLYYVQASSAKLGDALQRVARYSSIHNEGVHLDFRRVTDAKMSFEYAGVRRMDDRHQIEFFVALLTRLCRHFTGRHLVPSHVRYVHRRKDVPSDVRSFFGCDIVFGTAADEIVYSGSVADIPIIGADPYLNSLMLKYCDEAVANRRQKSSTWQTRVENAIAPLLPHGEARIEDICRKLGVSRRTLMRRLASEQQTFSKVLRDLRVELAKRYLRELGVPISELAWLLGYANASAFNHAFKRWTGVSPSDARHLPGNLLSVA